MATKEEVETQRLHLVAAQALGLIAPVKQQDELATLPLRVKNGALNAR